MSFFQPDPDAKPPTYTTATITVSSVPPTSDSERAPLLANRHYPAPSTATIENSTSQATLRQQQDQWTPPPLFFWVQLSLLCCVFLAGFDGTVTASTCAAIGSSFGRADMASWITTAYLLTATAIQPLYGRLSDIFGRRSCLLFASLCFATGCLGCASARDMVSLALSRAVTGVDGGGLMTMATITNSDLIPSHKRGLYQAAINVLHGVGSISGASLGGVLADSFGWRTCFAFQVPIALVAVWIARWAVPATSATAPSAVRVNKKDDVKEVSSMGGGIFTPHSSAGEVVEYDTEQQVDNEEEQLSKWNQVDFLGAALLVAGLGTQLAVLSLGGNELPWASPITLSMFVLAMVLLMLFIVIEARTDAVPIMPLRIMSNPATVGLLVSNVCLGMVGYGTLFLMPLFFQAVKLDSPSTAGLRMVAPALATPFGGLTTGFAMTRYGNGCLKKLTRVGMTLMMVCSMLLLHLGQNADTWRYSAVLVPGNFGQGIAYPSILFAFIQGFEFEDHAVSTSLIYLTRSMGTVWGVASISTITQGVLRKKLRKALRHVDGADEISELLRHSVEAIHDLPPHIQELCRGAYYSSIRGGMFFLFCTTVVAVIGSLATRSLRTRS